MPEFAILVEFDLKPGETARFMPLLLENAAASVRDEPGCHRFDVLTRDDGSDPDRIVLYEIYRDAAAFDAHLAAPHYARFKRLTADMVRETRLSRFAVTQHADGT